MMLRDLLDGARPALGHLIFEFATPGIGWLVRNAGADFLLFDMEHSGFTFETAKLAVLSTRAADIPLVLRVPSHDAKDLARACDIGADGVMVPLVGTPEEARSIVAAVKYPPAGRRGVSQVQMHDRYRSGPFADKARAANAALALFAQIESRQGVEHADAIAAVDGVDCLWVGHMDLSCSLGAPAQFDTPDFQASLRAVVAAARKHGKRAGRMVRNAEEGAAQHTLGFNCFVLGSDTQVYQAALAQGIGALRATLDGESP